MSSDSPLTVPDPLVPDPRAPGPQKNTTLVVVLVVALAAFLLIMIMCGGVLVALLLPAVQQARHAARSMQISNNMKLVGISLHNYNSEHGEFPLAEIADGQGMPARSWRVAILPYLEEQVLFDQWNADESWESPSNSALRTPMPPPYSSPLDEDPATTMTHVMTVRHPNGMMGGNAATKFLDVTDGLSSTILAVYIQNRSLAWTAPKDISLPELQSELANASIDNLVFLLMGDGAVLRVTEALTPQEVEALVTRDGGESPVIVR